MSGQVKLALAGALDRLRSHFKTKLVLVGKPASPKALASLRSRMGGLPAQLEELLALADGVTLQSPFMPRSLMTVEAIGDTVGGEARHGINPFTKKPMTVEPTKPHPRRVPIGDEGTGDHTWVLRGGGLGEGAVVWMDHEMEEDGGYALVGSSVAAYLDVWSRALVATLDERGMMAAIDDDDEDQVAELPGVRLAREHDPGARVLLADAAFAAYLKRPGAS